MAGLTTRTVQPVPVDVNGDPILGGLFSVGRDEFGRTDNYATGELPYRPMMPGQGAVQGTKHNRGEQPGNSLNEPWPGPIDQTVYRVPGTPIRLAAGELPPANYGTSSAYVPDGNAVVRALNPDGSYSEPLTAIQSATAPVGGKRWGWDSTFMPMGRLIRTAVGGSSPSAGSGTISAAPVMVPAIEQNAPPTKPAPVMRRGFNGRQNLTSNELSDTHRSIFSENTVLPPSMNTERWLTGY